MDDFQNQTREYELNVIQTIIQMEPTLSQFLKPSIDQSNVKRNETLEAEAFLQGLVTSSWIKVDDRALILENLLLHSRGSFAVVNYLENLLKGLNSPVFIKEKQVSLERVMNLVLKLRSRYFL